MHSIESWKLLETHGRLWKLMKASIILWNPMKVIRNSKEPVVRPKQLIWNGGTDTQTHRQTDTQTDRQTLVLSCAMRN